MKIKCSALILLFVLLCNQTFALRQSTTWQELQDSSDFIVWARVTKIEELSESKYRTTFTVKRIYRGEVPENVSFDWIKTDRVNMYDHYFSIYELSCDYILFTKKETDGYSMSSERFMRKYRDEHKKNFVPEVSMAHVGNLPPELEEKIDNPQSSARRINWSDIKEWLDTHYKNNTEPAVRAYRFAPGSPGTFDQKE